MAEVWRTVGVATCILFAAGRAAWAQGDSTAKASPGFYTAAQGDRGAEVYKGECARCHVLSDHYGPDFKLAWHGQTVRSLFDYLRTTMPDDDPGTLAEQQYLDVTAYLLKLNGMPAGDTPLVADTTALKKLIIDIKAAPAPGARLEQPLPGWLRRLLR